ncbi:MAG: TrkH family potassium uptake protein [Ruminococcaceae bacterium]|nr:TrkH family potassium uptake protein [Oscillospiraceae bacterium]
MNRRIIFYMLGQILKVEAVLMSLPLICSLVYGEKNAISFVITIVLALALGFLLTCLNKPKDKTFFAKEGFVIVALSWITLSVVGAIPFVISGAIPNFIDAFFETVSGFTTTGATILGGKEIETMSKGLLFWRSFTHWIGGMGILVLVMAIVPTDSGRSIHIIRAEMPGPIIGKLVPKLKSTAKILYLIYICLTLLEVVLLLCGGMNLFESFVHSFGTAGTGGFGVKGDSIASYSPYLQWVITVFMLIFGVNFNIYYLVLVRKIRTAFKSEELWCYVGIVIAAVALVTYNIRNLVDGFWETLRQSAFQVASIITTTGYATTDFNLWPGLSKGILLILMFIGACAGSTAGGIKVSRIVLLFKRISANLRHMIHPRGAEAVRFEGKKVENETLNGVLVYFAIYFVCFTVILIVLLFEPFDLETNISAVAACFNNVGPGLALVGPMGNYDIFSHLSKIVLSVAMLLGRLEIYPLILLFSPASWLKRRKIKK